MALPADPLIDEEQTAVPLQVLLLQVLLFIFGSCDDFEKQRTVF